VAIERAHVRAVQKPWGSLDLLPWSENPTNGVAVGELWYERQGDDQSRSALMLKLLFTEQNLSIQVHPGDAYARSIGLPHGKSEAWYILAAAPGAQVAAGLKKRISSPQLRAAIDDGSIADLIQWRDVVPGDVISIPAGTIHAIGPGVTLAEIQQRSDATFRMFDFGRGRELHVADAVAVADAGPAERALSVPIPFAGPRTLLTVNSHFVFERIALPPGTRWEFDAEKETWLLVLQGSGTLGAFDISVADVVFMDKEHSHLNAGIHGLECLAAYGGPHPAAELVRSVEAPSSDMTQPGRRLHLTATGASVPPASQETQS
jgi:mannose-6-phosphate isomerase